MALFWRKPRAQDITAPLVVTDVTKSGTDATVLKNKINKDLDKLAVIVRKSGRDIPTVVYSKIRSIDDVTRPLMDYIEAKDGCSPEQEYLLTKMVKEYIPDSINSFLAVNPLDRSSGSKPESMVVEQFEVMEQKMHELDTLIRSGAIDALVSQGFFLDMKFSN